MANEDERKTGKCLFSGDKLDESTKIEHTIPAALGGRITSRRVTSSKFNEATSDKYDKPFTDQYLPILIRLAPLLNKKLQEKSMILKSNDGEKKYRYKNAEISMDGLFITERDENGHPRSCLTPMSPNVINHVNKTFNWNPVTTMALSPVDLPDDTFWCRFNFTPEAHISALKSFLISFDEMLARINGFMFTRDPALTPLCDFIQKVVFNSPSHYFRELDKYYWGLQVNNEKIVKSILNEHQYKGSPFEHTMIVSSCSEYKMLYGVWDIFGFETLGFCLCPAGEWNGPSFSAIITNPILKDTHAPHIIVSEELNFRLCARTQYKCFSLNSDAPERPEDRYFQTIPKINAYHQAVYLVETTAESHILENFQDMSNRLSHEKTLSYMLTKRLCGLYSEENLQKGMYIKIQEAIQSISSRWEKYFTKDFLTLPMEDKHLFFEDYKAILKKIYDPIIPPGHVVSGAVSVISE